MTRAWPLLRRALLAAGSLLFAALVFALGMAVDPERLAFSYLAAWAAATAVALGALALVLIGDLTRAHWIRPMRGVAWSVAATLPLLALLFVPLVPALGVLYPWAKDLAGFAPEVQERILARRAWMNVPFFLFRSGVYFAAWSALVFVARPGAVPQPRRRAAAGAGVIVLAFTLTFAAFDWLMSLSPVWFSTVYGLDWFAAGFSAALAAVALGTALAASAGRLPRAPRRHEVRALGAMLLTFVVFRAYVAFSQLLVYWMGDVPERIAWFLPRLEGSWGVLAAGLVAGRFAVPLLLLLPRQVRGSTGALATVGAWILAMHYLDVYWLVLPETTPAGLAPHWLDLGALAVVLGLTGVATAALLPSQRIEKR